MSILSRDAIITQNNNQLNDGWNSYPNISLVNQVSNSLNSGLALNAMPTPFARAEVVREAFEAIGNNFNAAGKTYQNIVSDTLDVLEILYNYDLYKNCIKIYKRSISGLILPASTKTVNNQQVQVQYLKDALENYRPKDSQGRPIDDVYVITYIDGGNEYALAMSCPDTLFFTSSRLDRTVKIDGTQNYKNEYGIDIPRIGCPNQKLFDNPIDLIDRDQDFQDYLFHLYDTNRTTFGSTAIGRFIAGVFGQQRVNQFQVSTISPIQDSVNNAVEIALRNGSLALHQNNVPRADAIFRDEVVSIGYSINSDRFVTIKGHDSCLLPLKMDSFRRLNDTQFTNNIQFSGFMINPGNKALTLSAKKYTGVITPFDLGVYPFFKYPANTIKPRVATYHIMLSYEVNGVSQPGDHVSLKFYMENGAELRLCSRAEYNRPQLGINECVVKEVRTKKIDDNKTAYTVHYTVIGSNFDYIEVATRADSGFKYGVLKPKFDTLNPNTNQIQFAVDFGTTSTYVAVKEGNNTPTILTTKEQSMVYLHQGVTNGINASEVYKYEQYGGQSDDSVGQYVTNIPNFVKLIKQEFVPSSIDGRVYKFPIRTAVSYKNGDVKDIQDIFEDGNIAFTYDKQANAGDNSYKTNIKWDSTSNHLSSVYIREIVRMCIIHALSKSYQTNNIEFLYFYPLAMDYDTRSAIDSEWKNVCDEFGIQQNQIKEMTESLAPYYATPKANAQCIASIDIGGGSVDTVVYKDGVPQFATSSLFGCDVLWGNGRDGAEDSKNNPIYKKLLNEGGVADRLRGDLKEVNNAMTDPKSYSSSSDIINFWLSCKDSGVEDQLKLTKYHPIYVTHFYAILYHLAQMMNHKGINAPVEIALSGNGSLYLGNLPNDRLSTIATTAFKDIYGEDGVNKIKVTLPSANNLRGKEMTALGGLKYLDSNQNIPNIEQYIYLGGDKDLDIKKVSNVVENGQLREEVADKIVDNVCVMEANIQRLLGDLQMRVPESTDRGEHRTTLINAASSPRYMNQQSVVSTLFFAPVQQLIFDIEEKILNN